LTGTAWLAASKNFSAALDNLIAPAKAGNLGSKFSLAGLALEPDCAGRVGGSKQKKRAAEATPSHSMLAWPFNPAC